MSDLVGNPEDRFSRVTAHVFPGDYHAKKMYLITLFNFHLNIIGHVLVST